MGGGGGGRGFAFDAHVSPGGYAWWYLDAESDDGLEALVAIAFVGSVFSPHYARARRASLTAAPGAHCALNVALYRRDGGGVWAFSEYPRRVARGATQMRLGGSSVAWRDGCLVFDVQERTALRGAPLRGRIVLRPQSTTPAAVSLHPAANHLWWPVAPCARVEVDFDAPGQRWQGRGYHDANLGHAPLADGFEGWNWLRAWHPEGTLVHYDAALTSGAVVRHGALYRRDGRVEAVPLPPARRLPMTGWGLTRRVHGQADAPRCLEDTPFYARTRLRLRTEHGELSAMHEQLDLQRFERRWVQHLLPFRLRRR